MTLRERQALFAAALTAPALPPELASQLAGCDHEERMDVYRTNLFAGLGGVLRAAFPVIAALVGDAYMQGLATRFIRAHPPACADMNSYGADFPAFIAADHRLADMPFLADLAHMEWALHAASFAPDDEPGDLAPLAALAEDGLACTVLPLRNGVKTGLSRWPVLSLYGWARAPDETPPPDMDSGGECWLACRPELDAQLHPLGMGEQAFLRACACGQSIAGASRDAVRADSAFGLAAGLAAGMRHRIFGPPIPPQGL